ncbi:uncharacterized protein KIAA2013 homolog [Ambystoma mexicanum]
MWLQQRLKSFPGLLSSSWARRLLALLGFLLIFYWYLSSGTILRFLWHPGQPRGAAGVCLQAETKQWTVLLDKGDAALVHAMGEDGQRQRATVVGNGNILIDVSTNRLWIFSPSLSARVVDYPPLALLKAAASGTDAQSTAILFRDGLVRRVRCTQASASQSPRDCVTVREDFYAHRSRPHLYLQKIHIFNPSDRIAVFEISSQTPPVGAKFSTSIEKAEDRQFLLSSGRLQVEGGKVVLVVVGTKKLGNRVQVSPKSEFVETVVSVVYTSPPMESTKLDDVLSNLKDTAKKAMLEVMRMGVEDLLHEHQQMWSDLFISGIELKKSTDSHTPSSETVNITLYYILSSTPAPLLDPLISSEERDKMEASLNYADHCFSGHATMNAENLWPENLGSVPQILQLLDLWKLTLQKRGCKVLVAAGAHGLMQGIVLSFGGLQFTENHLQFQADPHLHNSFSLHGIHYNKDLLNLAVLMDEEEKPFLHVSVKLQDKPVRLYACEAGCMNEPVELTSEVSGHTFPVMVTQPLTPLLYISTDLTHLQDLRHTLHLKAILAHEEHMAKQDPGLPFIFWFSIASLITLFHLFLFKLIYNEYCGPGARPIFRSKEDETV